MNVLKTVALAGLLGISCSANATLYQFTYSFNDGQASMSGLFNGAADGDIITITDFESISYKSPQRSETTNRPLFLYSKSSDVARTSFSGKTQDFIAGYNDFMHADYWVVGALVQPGTDQISMVHNGWRSSFYNSADYPINASWKVTAAIPEPATYGMLLGGFGVIGLLARRKRTV